MQNVYMHVHRWNGKEAIANNTEQHTHEKKIEVGEVEMCNNLIDNEGKNRRNTRTYYSFFWGKAILYLKA